MADSGPTTAGSIIARLKMDRDQWIADMAKTKEDAREIGSLRPTIRIDVDTAGAMAQLEALRAATVRAGAVSAGGSPMVGPSAGTVAKVEAVTAAERRLAAAVSAADSAYARAELAQLRLNETREKGVKEGARLAAAELAASEALKRLDAANEKATLSEAALTAAQNKAVAAALKKAAAEETAAGATVKANEANKTSANRMGLIVSAVALLLPLLVPVAAGAVGIAGALTLMGGAGVAAVVGIKREMEQGTATGKEYSDGLLTLRQNANQLAQTGAVNMLRSFRSVTGDINGAMPLLNRQVGLFTNILGTSGGNLFSGSINGLRVMEPLLLTAGVYVQRLTRQFNEWTQNGGLEKFSSYALANLPMVERTLGALATMIMHILEALAPLGEVGMVVLTAISNGINGIPVETLGALIGAVTWGALAFKAWGFIAPMLALIAEKMIGVGVATTIATGPIGWIVAGLAALVAVISVVTISTQNATKAQVDYTNAIREDTGAIGENVRAQAAKNLQDVGAFANAKQLGISTKDLTSAVLGETSGRKALAEASKRVNDAYAETHKSSVIAGADNQKAAAQATQNRAWMKILNQQIRDQSDSMKDQIDKYNQLQLAIGGTTIATKAQRDAVEANAKAAGVSVSAYLGAMAAQGDTKAQLEKTTAAMYLQGDAAGLLKQQLDLLNGKTLNAAQAQNQFDSQLANMSDHMDASGKQIDRANTLLEGNTAAAVKNRGELISLTQAAENNAQAFRDNGGSVEDTRQKLIDMKQAIIDNAVAHGEDRDQVQQYVDTLFKIPDKIPPTKLEIDTAAAQAAMEAFFKRWNGAAINLTATGSAKLGSGILGHAGGGTIGGEGSGTSDSNLIWASKGEEMTRAVRAGMYRPMLKAINNGSPADVAAQASKLATGQSNGMSAPIVNHWNIRQNASPTAVAYEVQRRQNALAAV